jgi:hypothetical protein
MPPAATTDPMNSIVFNIDTAVPELVTKSMGIVG